MQIEELLVNCYLMFWTCGALSCIQWLQAVKNIWVRVNIKFKLTNQTCSSWKISQSTDTQWRNCGITIIFKNARKRLFSWESEKHSNKKKTFGQWIIYFKNSKIMQGFCPWEMSSKIVQLKLVLVSKSISNLVCCWEYCWGSEIYCT